MYRRYNKASNQLTISCCRTLFHMKWTNLMNICLKNSQLIDVQVLIECLWSSFEYLQTAKIGTAGATYTTRLFSVKVASLTSIAHSTTNSDRFVYTFDGNLQSAAATIILDGLDSRWHWRSDPVLRALHLSRVILDLLHNQLAELVEHRIHVDCILRRRFDERNAVTFG